MVGVVRILRADGRTRGGVGRENTLDVHVSVCVDQLAALQVDQQPKVSQKVGADDRLLHVCNNENPR